MGFEDAGIKIVQKISRNFFKITLPKGDLYVSYETCIAFKPKDESIVACENIWSKQTGIHLSQISKRHFRLNRECFEDKLRDFLKD